MQVPPKASSSAIKTVNLNRCVQFRTPRKSFIRFNSTTSAAITNQRTWRKIFEEEATRQKLASYDWYQVDIKNINEKTNELLKKEFKGSLYSALSTIFPETEWHPWKFEHEPAPSGYWKEQSNQRKFFDDLGKKIGIQTLDDWYQVLSLNTILQHGGSGLMSRHKQSPVVALMTAYPEHKWMPWKFKSISRGYWKDIANQRQYFDDLGKELGVKQLDDWYEKLSLKVVQNNGGISLLRCYEDSPSSAIMACYPEHNWIPWKFNSVPVGFWQSQDNRRKYFDWLGKELGIKELDDWYQKLSFDVMKKHAGLTLLKGHKGSAVYALMAAYPEHNWSPWKFTCAPKRYWNNVENQRKFFDDLGKKIGVQTLDDWYGKLSTDLLVQNGAGRLISSNQSVASALMHAYSEHNWMPFKFQLKGNWRSQSNVRLFLAELSEKLSIQTLDDWYRVDWKQINMLRANSLVMKYKGLYNLLKEQYPHHPWDSRKFQQTAKKTQRWLAVTLKKMFPNEEILEDYMHPRVVLTSSGRPLQLDVFIPSKNLAFEYQGKQHYEEVGFFSPTKTYQQRDEEKRALCAANNIKLIEVPYWWNRTREELQEIIDKSSHQ